MKRRCQLLAHLLIFLCLVCKTLWADNQTLTVDTPISGADLPFRVVLEKASFQLPEGFHSGVMGVYKGLWVFIAGSHLGLHGFGPDPFPPSGQNRKIYVVNPATGVTVSRSLTDSSSGLTQQQIDTIGVISPQAYQEADTLYMSGGYGIDTNSGVFTTKPVLTAFYLPGIVKWVTEPGNPGHSVVANIRQIYNPVFQIAGGEMFQLGDATRIVFGQNFTGVYNPGSNGDYSQQVRQFQLYEEGGELAVRVLNPTPLVPNPNYRRRDLNILPVLLNDNNILKYGLVAYSGVFTLTGGAWTVPVIINDHGVPSMVDPAASNTLKQGMNNYVSAATGLYSRRNMSMYNIFFGGISFGYFNGGVFQTDPELPFINQITTIQIDKNNKFTQYIMDSEYPVIPSTGPNPGNPLLFGAGAYFIVSNIQKYPNNVISLDGIRRPTVIGYIVGGITSTLPNTNTDADSFASPYVFKVTLIPK